MAALVSVSRDGGNGAARGPRGVALHALVAVYPVICKEDMGPVSSLKRSSALVRGHFWFVLGTATLAFVSEEAAIHTGALVAGTITGSHTWGEWVGGSIVAALAIPLAALTTSVAYSRVAKRSRPLEGS